MFEVADYKLSDFLGIAGATIGIIIAGSVFLQCLITRYTAIFDRYRALTGEHRENHASDSRRSSLLKQISTYRRQIRHLNTASMCVAASLFLFVFTVATASLSVIFPKAMPLRTIGTLSLMGGLLLIGLSTVLVAVQAYLERMLIGKEVEDISDVPSLQDALR